MKSDPIIEVNSLSRSFKQYKKEPGMIGSIKSFFNRQYYEVTAVDNVSFEVAAGEMIGFIGPNGAGKTTTLKMLSGILHPSSGDVKVLGYRPFKRQKEFQKQFSLVMGQKSQLWWDLPPLESFILNKEIYEVPSKEFRNNLAELTELLNAKEFLEVPVRKLSLGQRMKCELIASLLHKPKLLFLDEPTIGLDVVVQKNLRQFLKEYNRKHNITMLLTSHYMDDVEELCKRIIIISDGGIIFDGRLNELLDKYVTEKHLKLVFKQKTDISALQKYGEVIEHSEDQLVATLLVSKSEHTQIAGQILQVFEVDDLDISEVNLEEVIAKIFAANS